MTAQPQSSEGRRPARRDRAAEARAQRGDPRPLLPEARNPGPRRFRRRQPRSVAQGGRDRRRGDRLLRRPLHGRDGEDPVARKDRDPARHGRRLQPRGQLPARPVRRLPRRAPGPYRADLHQLLGGGESAQRHHRHQSSARRSSSTRSRKDQKIIFGPDRHLGGYLARKTGREMLLWPGICIVHQAFSETELLKLKAEHPGRARRRAPRMPAAHHRPCRPCRIDHARSSISR